MDTVKGRLGHLEMASQWKLNVKRGALVWFRHDSGDCSETVNSSSFLWILSSLRAPKCYVIINLSRCHLFLLCFIFFLSHGFIPMSHFNAQPAVYKSTRWYLSLINSLLYCPGPDVSLLGDICRYFCNILSMKTHCWTTKMNNLTWERRVSSSNKSAYIVVDMLKWVGNYGSALCKSSAEWSLAFIDSWKRRSVGLIPV